MDRPRVSVIVPTRNRAHTLKRMLDELLSDEYDEVEIIVVDGASTDGTVDLLKSYGDRIRWISEPDDGEYFAINKGLCLARGDIIKLMSDDDVLLQGTVAYAVQYFDAHPDVDVLFGHYLVFDDRKDASVPVFDSRSVNFTDANFSLRNTLRLTRLFPTSISSFARRRVFDTLGLMSTEYRCGDAELWIRVARAGMKMTITDRLFVHYHLTGENGITRRRWQTVRDHIRLVHRYGTFWDVVIFVVACGVGEVCRMLGFHPRRMLRRLGFTI
jgi:glycosyltransferase involved in cell wall biosynthesis